MRTRIRLSRRTTRCAPASTHAELLRLGPDGNTYDGGVQVYLVGPIGPAVRSEVEGLGFEVRAFAIDDPFALSEVLDTWAAAVHTDHPDEVAIVQYQQLDTGLLPRPATTSPSSTLVTGRSRSPARCSRTWASTVR